MVKENIKKEDLSSIFQLKKNLMNARFKKAIGEEVNISTWRTIKKQVARIKNFKVSE